MAPTDPHRIILPNGKPGWLWPDGRMHPVVSGGIDDGGSDDEGDDDDPDGDDDGTEAALSAEEARKIRQALHKANKEAEKARLKVKEYEDATKSEQEKLTESLTAAEKRAEMAALNALRYEVALDNGIPKSIASRLQGATREELEEDAKSLLTEMGTPTRTPSFDGGAKDKDAPSGGSFLAQAIRNKRSA